MSNEGTPTTRNAERPKESSAGDTCVAADTLPGAPPASGELAPDAGQRAPIPRHSDRPVADLASGEIAKGGTVGRYIVLGRIGAGAMGVVYAAYDPELDRKIALKVLHPEAATSDQGSSGRARLLREAQAMARLTHPNVVTVHDVGSVGESVFVAMEFVDGGTLADWQTEGRRSWQEVIELYVAAGRGLAAAHASGLIHRDFKPSNVLLGKAGRVLVADFGLARPVTDVPSPPSQQVTDDTRPISASPSLGDKLTQTGALMGTPAYMSLEQLLGAKADARTDQFSFCVALWEALYGQRPFPGDSLVQLSRDIAQGKLREPPADSRVPSWLKKALQRGLRATPEDRHASMDALLTELTRDRRVFSTKVLVLAGVGVVALTAALGFRASRGAPRACRGAERELAGVWDGGRKDAVRGALMRSGAPWAQQTWQHVHDELDRWSHRWVSMHVEACEATRVRGEQSGELLDKRMLCLSRQLQEVRSLTSELARADLAAASRAAESVTALPNVQACADIAGLMSREGVPNDPAIRGKIEKVHGALADAMALRKVQKFARALDVAGAAVIEARALKHRPTEAEALLELGRVQQAAGEIPAAAQSFEEAAWIAEASREDGVAAEAGVDLVYLAGYVAGNPPVARMWSRIAESALSREGGNPAIQARLMKNNALTLVYESRYADGLAELRKALELTESVFGPDHLEVADFAYRVGALLSYLGEADEALQYHQRALKIRQDKLGPAHPDVAKSLANVATILGTQGKDGEALGAFHKALEVSERALGKDHPDLAYVLTNLGEYYVVRDQTDAAIQQFERALAIIEKVGGPGNASAIDLWIELGWAAREARRFDAAERYLQTARAQALEHLGQEHGKLADAIFYLGLAYAERGDHRKALATYQEATPVAEKAYPKDSAAFGNGSWAAGESLLALGETDAAIREFERSVQILGQGKGETLSLARAQIGLAKALSKARRDPARVRTLASEGLTAFVKAGTFGRKLRADAEWFVAQLGP
jgi:eukaryotic-like serine/threonine-protein kinase